MVALVWHVHVRDGRGKEFEHFFGADGVWHALSRRSRSFLGSSFLRDLAQPSRYLAVDYWSEMLVYEKHQADFRDEIRQLEQERDQLVESIALLGIFTALDVPDRTGPTWSRRSGVTE